MSLLKCINESKNDAGINMSEGMKCENCEGRGYTVEHDPNCNGRCDYCPIQVWCEKCQGTGKPIEGDWGMEEECEICHHQHFSDYECATSKIALHLECMGWCSEEDSDYYARKIMLILNLDRMTGENL